MRLFLALWPPAAVRDALAAYQARWDWPATAARVAPGRLHLTLHFLGAVDATRDAALREGLRVPAQPFALDLAAARAGVWPGGIAVLEVDASPPLARLHADLAAALRALDLPVETRRFRPHVTLARKATGARAAPVDGLPDAWRGDGSYALVRSTPGRGYDTLHSYVPA